MILYEYQEEKHNLSNVRRREARVEFLRRLKPEDHEEFIEEMMELATSYEMDDYFGTEGMEV